MSADAVLAEDAPPKSYQVPEEAPALLAPKVNTRNRGPDDFPVRAGRDQASHRLRLRSAVWRDEWAGPLCGSGGPLGFCHDFRPRREQPFRAGWAGWSRALIGQVSSAERTSASEYLESQHGFGLSVGYVRELKSSEGFLEREQMQMC